MATAYVGPEWDAKKDCGSLTLPVPARGEGKREQVALGSDSGASTVAGAVGKGGAAVIGRVPGAAALVTELVRRGVHVMVYDVNTCSPVEWDALERAASRAGVRLRCGSHISRFAPVMAGVRAYAEGHIAISAAHDTGSERVARALAADVAMTSFSEAPQAVFASVLEDDSGNTEGHERDVADHAAVMMRFSRGRAALVSVDERHPSSDVIYAIPPDPASVCVEISGHGGFLNTANLATGALDALRIMHPGGLGGMRAPAYEEGDADGLAKYLSPMLTELETGMFPDWPPPDWLEKDVISARGASGQDGTPLDPPWWPARSTWKEGQPMSLPPPSSLAHVMEAILVSINTGAPVYLDQR